MRTNNFFSRQYTNVICYEIVESSYNLRHKGMMGISKTIFFPEANLGGIYYGFRDHRGHITMTPTTMIDHATRSEGDVPNNKQSIFILYRCQIFIIIIIFHYFGHLPD